MKWGYVVITKVIVSSSLPVVLFYMQTVCHIFMCHLFFVNILLRQGIAACCRADQLFENRGDFVGGVNFPPRMGVFFLRRGVI